MMVSRRSRECPWSQPVVLDAKPRGCGAAVQRSIFAPQFSWLTIRTAIQLTHNYASRENVYADDNKHTRDEPAVESIRYSVGCDPIDEQ